MDRRHFLKSASALPIVAGLSPSALAAPAPAGQLTPPRAQSNSGPLYDRFQLTLDRVLRGDAPSYNEEFVLADVRPAPERRFTEYSGDVSGRYIGALAVAARAYGVQIPQLADLVNKVIALQKPDGYFGSSFHYENPGDLDMALLWGNGRLLVGLLEYYQLSHAPEVLASSKRIGDFLARIGPMMLSAQIRSAFGAQHFASSYICWTQQTEGLALLYAETKDERYSKLAEKIAAVTQRLPGDHAHGYLTSLRGIMVLYDQTRDATLLKRCEDAWQDITASKDLLITGGVPEGWSPNNHRTEGCGEADWVRLNLALWRATHNDKYLTMADRAIFNEFAFNQYATGDFGHRVYTETGLPAAGAVRAWWCCTLHGLRCFPDIHDATLSMHRGAIRYELPLDAHMETDTFAAIAESNLANDGTIRLRILRAPKTPTTLLIRKPAWAQQTVADLNGAGKLLALEEGYLGAERIWSAGDQVAIRYEMKLTQQAAAPGRTAFWFGPWLLGASSNRNPSFFNELTEENKLLGDERSAQIVAARPFDVPVAAHAFRFAQAEYPDQPGTVTLSPIAEQTGQTTASWELRFLAGPDAKA